MTSQSAPEAFESRANVESGGHSGSVEIVPYERGFMDGVVALCAAERWATYSDDPERTHRACTAPGMTAFVARDDREIVGLVCIQSDGVIQAHLSLIVVAAPHRRRGVARELILQASAVAGGWRIDLVTAGAEAFYASFDHRRLEGFRIYPNPSGADPLPG